MGIDKDEIERLLAHQRKMLRTLRNRLEQRELQEAQQGINTDPQVITEINDLTERIQRHEDEIARLKTLAAEDKEPLAEVEYRALLAEAWDTPQGHPKVASIARLELSRLRLGIALQRAQVLEHEVRIALAAEAVANVDARYLPGLFPDQSIHRSEFKQYKEATVRLIERAIRFDLDTTLQSFTERLYSALVMYPVREAGEVRSMFIAAKAWGNVDEQRRVERFIDAVESILIPRQAATTAKSSELTERPSNA